VRSLLASAILAALVPAAAAAEDLQPGQYRATVTSDIPGDKPNTDTHCVTQKDIDSGLQNVGSEKDPSCKTLDFKRGPGSVSYRMVCTGNGQPPTTQVAGTFTRDTFDMKIQMQVEPKGKPNNIRMVGKRIGACTGK
jgi:hypothetical protein